MNYAKNILALTSYIFLVAPMSICMQPYQQFKKNKSPESPRHPIPPPQCCEELLVAAALHGNTIATTHLLTIPNIHVNWRNDAGLTALYSAAYNNDSTLVKILLENGADVNQQSSFGWTPLMAACCFGREESVKFLLQANADMHIKNNYQKTARDIATDARQEAIIAILDNAWADSVLNLTTE